MGLNINAMIQLVGPRSQRFEHKEVLTHEPERLKLPQSDLMKNIKKAGYDAVACGGIEKDHRYCKPLTMFLGTAEGNSIVVLHYKKATLPHDMKSSIADQSKCPFATITNSRCTIKLL